MTKILALVLMLAVVCPRASAHPGSGIAVDSKGQVFFIDTGRGVWKIDAQGRLVPIGGPRFHWFALDEKDRFKSFRSRGPTYEFTTVEDSGYTLVLSSDFPVELGQDGNLYFAPAPPSGQPLQLVRMDPQGRTSPFASIRGADGAPLRWINGIARGPNGSFYVTGNAAVHRISERGDVTLIAGRIQPEGCSKDPLPDVTGPHLRGLAVDAAGAIYVAATGCRAVIRIDAAGSVRIVARAERPWSPTAVAVRGGDLYVLEYDHSMPERQWVPRVRKIGPGGQAAVLGKVKRD